MPLKNVLETVKATDFYCPGSILALDIDTRQPLARGFDKSGIAYFINSSAFEIAPEKSSISNLKSEISNNANALDTDVSSAADVSVIARYASENTLLSGYLLGDKLIAGKAALVEVKLGRGRVVLFGFRPQHRGQTWATLGFIFNAINSEQESKQ